MNHLNRSCNPSASFRRCCAPADPFPFTPWNLQSQLLRDVMHAPMPHQHALASQKRSKAPVSEATPLGGELRDPFSQAVVQFRLALITIRRSRLAHQPPGSAFAGSVRLPQVCNRRSLLLRAHHFFPTRSFSIVISSACSATIRFSFAFSSSNCFKRFASLTSHPTVLAAPGIKRRRTDRVLSA